MRIVFLVAVKFYQKFLTRFTPVCPMTPCCSDYGYAAVRDHGFRIGIDMTVAYIQRCGKEDTSAQPALHQ